MTQLTATPGPDGLGAFAPDGTKIAFVSRADIYLMNPDGSGQTPIASHPTPDILPKWQPIPRPAVAAAPDSRAPVIGIAGVGRACVSSSFRARVTVDEPVQSVEVSLDRRRLVRSTKTSFGVRVPVRGLRGGVHRLTVVAVDAAGNRTRRTTRFRICAARAPRFTG